jgi:hypothetical protein
LISALSASGQDDITDALSLVKRNFDRHQADGLRWFILSIEGVFVGYGVGLYALFCTLSITVILAFVSGWILYARIAALSSRPPRSPQRSPYWCFAVCFVSTIPILSLPKSVDDFLHTPLGERGPGSVPVSGPTAAMFFLLSAFGWGMSGLLIHGLIRLFDL